MPCLIALFALIGPRVALIFTVIFSDMSPRDRLLLVALLGFMLLPWTTLAYVVMQRRRHGPLGRGLLEWIFVGRAARTSRPTPGGVQPQLGGQRGGGGGARGRGGGRRGSANSGGAIRR